MFKKKRGISYLLILSMLVITLTNSSYIARAEVVSSKSDITPKVVTQTPTPTEATQTPTPTVTTKTSTSNSKISKQKRSIRESVIGDFAKLPYCKTYGGLWEINNSAYNVNAGDGYKAIFENSSYSNFTIETNISITNNTSYSDAGIIFRGNNFSVGTNAFDGYYIGIDAYNKSIIVGKAFNTGGDGVWTTIDVIPAQIEINTVYRLKVEAYGSNIKAYVNGELKAEIEDTTYTSGYIGLRNYRTGSSFSCASLTKVTGNTISSTKVTKDIDGNTYRRIVYKDGRTIINFRRIDEVYNINQTFDIDKLKAAMDELVKEKSAELNFNLWYDANQAYNQAILYVSGNNKKNCDFTENDPEFYVLWYQILRYNLWQADFVQDVINLGLGVYSVIDLGLTASEYLVLNAEAESIAVCTSLTLDSTEFELASVAYSEAGPERALSLSTRFLNKMDPLWENAGKIEPIKGYQDIICHGDKLGFVWKDAAGNETNVSVAQFAEILKDNPVYNGGPIRLCSCETGADDAIAAQYLANYLDVEVLAPSDVVYVDFNGKMTIGTNDTGTWKTFHPKE